MRQKRIHIYLKYKQKGCHAEKHMGMERGIRLLRLRHCIFRHRFDSCFIQETSIERVDEKGGSPCYGFLSLSYWLTNAGISGRSSLLSFCG